MKIRELFKTPSLSARASVGVLILRLVSGLAFMIHGWGKIQAPFGWMGPDAKIPGIFQALAAISEFGGGLAWILGLLMPLASLGQLFTMLVAIGLHVFVLKHPFVGPTGSFEPAAVYLCVSLLFIFTGPGRFSLDRLAFGEKQA